jgi:hypothetical protein
MGRKKAGSKKKGGENFNIKGPLLVDKLYDAKYTGKIENLKSIYDENLKNKEKELITVTQNLKNMKDAENDEKMRKIEITKVNNIKKIADDKQSFEKWKDFKKDSSGFIASIAILFSSLFTNIKSLFHSILYFAGFSGEGILFKFIIFTCAIAIIVFIILGFTGQLPSMNFTNVNDITKKILMTDNEFNLMNIDSGSMFSKMSKSMYGLVPDEYKYKFNALNNSLTYISTGKNQFDDFLEPRNEIIKGRNDNIFHIITSNQKDNTQCLLIPKDINIEFPKDYYNNIDYNNLNSNLEVDINYPTILNIPFKIEQKNNSGKYVLDTSRQSYSNLANDVTAKIAKDKYLLIQKNNKILLNSFNNINYNNNEVIAMYGTKLINKKYTGPIMIIVATDNNNKSIYRNLYYNSKTQKLYYDDNIELDFKTHPYYYIHILFDQTGNGYNFIYEQYDDKYSPMLVYNNNIYSIEFFRRAILYLSKKYPNIKSTINATIKFKANKNNESYQKGIKYEGNKDMFVLSSYDNNDPIMSITIDDIHSLKFKFNNKEYDFNKLTTLSQTYRNLKNIKLLLSCNNGEKMFHGYLTKLTINNTYIYGSTYNRKNATTDKRIPIMLINKNNVNTTLFCKTGDTELYYFSTPEDENKYINNKINEPTTELNLLENVAYYDIIKLYNQSSSSSSPTIDDNYFENFVSDERYKPSLVKLKGKYAIRFFRRSLLIFNKRLANINNIEADIYIESEKCNSGTNFSATAYDCKYDSEFDNIKDYMDLLASKKSSIITLNMKDGNIYNEELKYNIKNNVDTFNTNNIEYIGKNNTTISIDLDNPSLIECLGVVNDIRSEDEKRLNPAKYALSKADRDNYIKEHSFLGNLYDLTIYKKI